MEEWQQRCVLGQNNKNGDDDDDDDDDKKNETNKLRSGNCTALKMDTEKKDISKVLETCQANLRAKRINARTEKKSIN